MVVHNTSLTGTQVRLWFLHQLEPRNPMNHVSATLRLAGGIDPVILETSLRRLLDQHDLLSVYFAEQNGEPAQRRAARATFSLRHAEAPDGTRARHLAEAFARDTFDLAQAPLLRAQLVAFGEHDALLTLTAHAMLLDEDSLEQILMQLAGHYEAQTAPALPVPPRLSDAADLVYWQQQLAGAPTILDLPADHPRPAAQGFLGGTQPFSLSPDVLPAVNTFCKEHDASLETVLLTAYIILLARYSGQKDLLAGVLDRPADFDAQLGPYSDLLVIRAVLDDGPGFGDLVRRIGKTLTEARQHRSLSFAGLLEVINPARDLSRQPLVQVTFRLREHSAASMSFNGARADLLRLPPGGCVFDLALDFEQHADHIDGMLHYLPDLYDTARIERIKGHFETLLRAALQDPAQDVTQLPILTPAERDQILLAWNDTAFGFEPNTFVYRLFEQQAEAHPESIAASEPGSQISYGDLNRRANRLAHAIVAAGLGADDLVALIAERSIDYLTALLAIHKAGAAFLPLDPHHPGARLAQVLDQSEAPLVLISPGYRPVLAEALTHMQGPAPTLRLIGDLLAEDWPDTNLPDRCELDSLAYVMFTSGSTGTPKGVMVEHRGMINHNYAKIRDCEMDASSILAQNGPQSFDIMVWQFLAPLIVGGRVQIFPDEVAVNPAALLDEVERTGVTVLQIVPALLTAMVQEAAARGAQRPALNALRWVVPTGEALPTELCRQWLRLYPDIPLLNTYGATECSDDQCHYPIRSMPAPDYPLPIMTIGTPIPNMRLYVLDRYLQPVPVGVIGELYVGGIGVGRGYLRDPERTAKAFIPDPFTPGMRLYHTGDRGRFWPDGTVEFLGRVDHMVKMRGYRIELGEIEAVLNRHPAVNKVAVILREDQPGQQHLVAYVVPGEEISGTDLREAVAARLPEYMVPSMVVFLEDIPLTSNGKLDRKALPAPQISDEELARRYVAPHSKTERILVKIWQDVLGIPRIGIQDNFFELGGHSLTAVLIFSLFEKKTGKRLPLSTLFRTPTIEALAALADKDAQESHALWAPVVEIQSSGSRPAFFCLGGGVINLHNLARYLGPDQPFYALQTESLDGYQATQASIEEVGAFFVEALRAQQPHGPYYLGGAYDSGLVILEVGRQLQAANEKVAFMALFNTHPFERFLRSFGTRVARRLTLNPIRLMREVSHIDWLHFSEALQGAAWARTIKACEMMSWPLPGFMRGGEFEEHLVRRIGLDHPSEQGFSGSVTLFYTFGWYENYMALPRWGWKAEFLGELTTREVPGEPCDMFLEPHVSTLAEAFRAELERAQASAMGSSSVYPARN